MALNTLQKYSHHYLSRQAKTSMILSHNQRFFTILELPQDFLEYDPSEGGNQDTFQRTREIDQSGKVVNDLAERGVALIQEFNLSITQNEEQKKFLLQVVEDQRSAFPAPTKDGAIKRTKSQ